MYHNLQNISSPVYQILIRPCFLSVFGEKSLQNLKIRLGFDDEEQFVSNLIVLFG